MLGAQIYVTDLSASLLPAATAMGVSSTCPITSPSAKMEGQLVCWPSSTCT